MRRLAGRIFGCPGDNLLDDRRVERLAAGRAGLVY
jgi:hypothetical protein